MCNVMWCDDLICPHSGLLHNVSQHNDGVWVLLPHHSPEVVSGVHHRTWEGRRGIRLTRRLLQSATQVQLVTQLPTYAHKVAKSDIGHSRDCILSVCMYVHKNSSECLGLVWRDSSVFTLDREIHNCKLPKPWHLRIIGQSYQLDSL